MKKTTNKHTKMGHKVKSRFLHRKRVNLFTGVTTNVY